MTDLDISDSHILESGHFRREPAYARGATTVLVSTSPGATDPMVIEDGIDRISVVQETAEQYLLHYQGYIAGYLRVTAQGVCEFGETYLESGRSIPLWSIRSLPEDTDDPPWWVPDAYDTSQTVECVRCRDAVPPSELVTPGRADGDVVDWFCRDCWEAVGERWSPEWAHAGRADIHRAKYLEDLVRREPAAADMQELAALVQSEEGDARTGALTALGLLVPHRADDVATLVPLLADTLDSDHILTQFGGLSCLAVLAEHGHEAVLPYAGDVIALLDSGADEGILEEAISYVAAVAETHPEDVREAAPKLAALLPTEPPHERKLLNALLRIVEADPEAVEPAAPTLREYVADESSQYRAHGLYALGHMAKASPAAAKESIPTLVDLLDSPDDHVRANAAGVLADLSEAYPGKLVHACSRVADLAAAKSDEKGHAQHNATYLLSQVAKQYPGAVEPTVDALIAALESDRSDTRFNACRALGYVGAETVVEPLEQRRDGDSDTDVQRIAGWALGQIGAGDP